MSSPMFPEISESTASSRQRRKKPRKIWKRPIRLPSFGFSGSDFTFDQIPAIFSGYAAGSEDSSSSEMSDASGSYSQSVSSADEHEEISHVRSTRAVRRRASLKRMKSISRFPSMKFRRQLTRKLPGGTQTRHKLKKIRSVKLSSSRNSGFKNYSEAIGLASQPRYLKPTSSSASKNVGKIQKNLKPNLGATAKKFSGGLTRTRSLRYTGLLRATCSSALKDSKIGNDVSDGKVCKYMYCSLHGHHHSRADNVNVSSLKRFVSMRRRLLKKKQRSTNRRLILLKRSVSRKIGSATGADQESSHVNVSADGECDPEIHEEHVSSSEIYGNGVESVPRSPETHSHSGLEIETQHQKPVFSAGNQWGNLSEADECRPERDTVKNVKLWRLIYQQMVTGLSDDTENSEPVKSDETPENSEKFSGESSRCCQDGSGGMEDEDNSKDVQAIEHDKSNAVKIVKQSLDEILSEITDYSSDGKSVNGDEASEHEHAKGEDDQGLDVSRSKNWRNLKNVVLLKRFLGSLEKVRNFDRREAMRLRQGEWMLDYALRQVISSLAPTQKRKVEILVQAFESVIPVDGFRARDLGNPRRTDAVHADPDSDFATSRMEKNGKSEIEKVGSENNPGENGDESTGIQAVYGCLKSNEAAESLADASLCEEGSDGSSSSEEDERIEHNESGTMAEKQNLIKWRNLIYKHMVKSSTVNDESKHRVLKNGEWSSGIDRISDGDAADSSARAVKLIQQALEKIVSEIPDQEETVSSCSSSGNRDLTGRDSGNSWNSLKKVILLKRFVKSLEKVRKLNPRTVRNLPVESEFEAGNVNLRSRSSEHRTDSENMMLDHALRQAISRLAPFQIRKVALLVHAFDSVLDGGRKSGQFPDDHACRDSDHEAHMESMTEPGTVEEEKDTKLWNLIYKHMVTDLQTTKNSSDRAYGMKTSDHNHGCYDPDPMAAVEDDCPDEGGVKIEVRSSGVVRFVREALEKILSEIPDHSSDEQSVYSDVTTDQELSERPVITSQVTEPESRQKPSEKSSRNWSNLKKAILLRRFVKELGTLTKLRTGKPRTLPLESDPEAEKINLRHLPLEGRKSSEEWMLDYALQQAISTLAPLQKRKVALLAQAFDTVSLQDTISFPSPSSRQSSHSGGSPEARTPISNPASEQTKRGYGYEVTEEGTRVFHLKKTDDTCKISSEKPGDSREEGEFGDEPTNVQQCTSLWRLLCKQMESGITENERNQTTFEEENSDGSNSENRNEDGESVELYQSEAVELLGEVIDEISQTDAEKESRQKTETEEMPQVRKGWNNLKRVILLKRFVKALEKVRKFDPREPGFLPLGPDPDAEKVNLRHQETRNKRNGEEWMVDYALQGVVSKLTPARRRKVQLLVQAFETVSATGN